MKEHDRVNNPRHYAGKHYGIECIEITENMDFCTGNAFKYVWRCDDKESHCDDLKKAIWYLNRALKKGWTKIENVDTFSKILLIKENDKRGEILWDIYQGFLSHAINAIKKEIEELNEN